NPLDGVSVTVKRTGAGTATGADGRFSLDGIQMNDILVFKRMGYVGMEVATMGKLSVDIVMEEDMAGLDEVVVVGYGTQKKSSVTGAIAKVENKILDQVPVGRPELA